MPKKSSAVPTMMRQGCKPTSTYMDIVELVNFYRSKDGRLTLRFAVYSANVSIEDADHAEFFFTSDAQLLSLLERHHGADEE